MEMTFFIPPVFLFGNNANRVPHDEEKKPEYKTAAETEIKVENWRVKRIAELEEKIEKLLWEKIKLEEQNENLKVESEELKIWLREKLPLALLKEYMEKFEGVNLKNV